MVEVIRDRQKPRRADDHEKRAKTLGQLTSSF